MPITVGAMLVLIQGVVMLLVVLEEVHVVCVAVVCGVCDGGGEGAKRSTQHQIHIDTSCIYPADVARATLPPTVAPHRRPQTLCQTDNTHTDLLQLAAVAKIGGECWSLREGECHHACGDEDMKAAHDSCRITLRQGAAERVKL